VDGAQIGVLEETDQIGLASLLKCTDGGGLESEIGLEILRDLAHEALEGQLANEQLSALLVATDLAKRHCARAITMRLLDASGAGCALARSLGGELLAWRLATGRLAGCLFRAGYSC